MAQFFDLPLEIRYMIYNLAIPSTVSFCHATDGYDQSEQLYPARNCPVQNIKSSKDTRDPKTCLLLVNKQVQAELCSLNIASPIPEFCSVPCAWNILDLTLPPFSKRTVSFKTRTMVRVIDPDLHWPQKQRQDEVNRMPQGLRDNLIYDRWLLYAFLWLLYRLPYGTKETKHEAVKTGDTTFELLRRYKVEPPAMRESLVQYRTRCDEKGQDRGFEGERTEDWD